MEQRHFDVLVLGSGLAGLGLALRMADHATVAVVSKSELHEGSSYYAQGGIAAVLGDNDSIQSHEDDTLRAGVGLCRKETVDFVITHGPENIRWLIDQGVGFSLDPDSNMYHLTREGGHSHRRVIHAADATGQAIETTLEQKAREHPNITIFERDIAIDLITSRKLGLDGPNRCIGAYILDRDSGHVHVMSAANTVLATGGASKVYLYTSNPDVATGDGVAMAWRGGAEVANMEFIQFHPTCLYHPRAKNFLISEAVRGEGGRLIDERGNAFMQKYDPRGDLATRDMVARAIDQEMKTSGDDCVFLDISHRHAEFVKNRFPNIYRTCLSYGIDITRDPIPVVPAAHYMCGGILTDRDGKASIPGLYAFGETACTGLHGGNRLASNSLLEAVVFAHQAYEKIASQWGQIQKLAPAAVKPWSSGKAERIEECILITHNWDQIRRLMWNYVGIVRTEKRLRLVQERLEPIIREVNQHYRDYILTSDLVELRNLALVAELIVRSALMRKESRGLHFVVDYPAGDDKNSKKFTVLQRPVPVALTGETPSRQADGGRRKK